MNAKLAKKVRKLYKKQVYDLANNEMQGYVSEINEKQAHLKDEMIKKETEYHKTIRTWRSVAILALGLFVISVIVLLCVIISIQ